MRRTLVHIQNSRNKAGFFGDSAVQRILCACLTDNIPYMVECDPVRLRQTKTCNGEVKFDQHGKVHNAVKCKSNKKNKNKNKNKTKQKQNKKWIGACVTYTHMQAQRLISLQGA